jgi:arabinofuranosyltransferase
MVPDVSGSPASSWVTAYRRTLIALLVAGLALYHVVAIVDLGLGRVDGRVYPLVDDDIMITMRYGRSLARGDGLVYNAGERVEGFTNPLLTFVTAGLHLLPIPERLIPGVLMVMNIAISLGILMLLLRFWGDSPGGQAAGVLAGLFYLLLPSHMWHAHAGYEVYMQMAILLYALWRIDRLRPIDALILGLLPLTHQTGLVMWSVLVVACVLISRPLPRALWLALLAVLPFAAYELFRIAYYGEILPNTYYLKVGGGTLRGGFVYMARWGLSIVPVALLAIYAVIHRFSVKRWLMAVLVVVHTASVVAVGGDILPQFRFLLPCSVLLAALAGAGAVEWLWPDAQAERTRGGAWRLRAALFAALLVLAVATPAYMARRDAGQFESQRRWNMRHVATGLALNENTPADAVVALFGLGFTGYYADRITIDMLGKADHHIARLAPQPGRHLAHNKSDVDYVVSRQPSYLELNLSQARFDDLEWLRRWQREDRYGYTYDLALNPQFRERYNVGLKDVRGRRVPFAVRNDIQPRAWRVPDAFYDNLESWEQ